MKYYSQLRTSDGLKIAWGEVRNEAPFWSMSCLKQGHLELVVQDCVQMALQHLKGWRLHSFPVEHHSSVQPPTPKLKKVFSDVQENFHMFQFVTLASHPQDKGIMKIEGPHLPFASEKPNEKKRPWKCLTLCIFSNYAKYEIRSMSQNGSLDCFYDAGNQFVILGQNHNYVLLCAMGDLLPAWICPSSSSNLTRFHGFFQVCWALLAFSKLNQHWIIN